MKFPLHCAWLLTFFKACSNTWEQYKSVCSHYPFHLFTDTRLIHCVTCVWGYTIGAFTYPSLSTSPGANYKQGIPLSTTDCPLQQLLELPVHIESETINVTAKKYLRIFVPDCFRLLIKETVSSVQRYTIVHPKQPLSKHIPCSPRCLATECHLSHLVHGPPGAKQNKYSMLGTR